jgi:hypothetical protein
MKLELYKYFNCGGPVVHPTRAFCSILPWNDGYTAVVREFNIMDADGANHSDIRRLKYDNNLTLLKDDLLCRGEDPRLFYYKNDLYCIAWTWTHNVDWNMFLVNVSTGEVIQLQFPDYKGKNWIPFVENDKLYIIHSFQPLVMLEIIGNQCLYRCGSPAASPSVFPTPDEKLLNGAAANQMIGEYRGGSNAISKDGIIKGFGHRTINRDRHSIFYYQIENDTIQIEECEVKGLQRYDNVLDPTSFWDNKVAISSSGEAWHKYQTILHAILIKT